MHIHVHKKKKHKYATKKPFVCSKDVNHIHIGLDKKKLQSSNNLAMLTISLSSFLSLSHTHTVHIRTAMLDLSDLLGPACSRTSDKSVSAGNR